MTEYRIVEDTINNVKKLVRYDEQDTRSVYSQSSKRKFGVEGDYIETYIYDLGNNILSFIDNNQNIIKKFDNPDIVHYYLPLQQVSPPTSCNLFPFPALVVDS